MDEASLERCIVAGPVESYDILSLIASSSLLAAMVNGHLLSCGLTLSFYHDSITC